MAVRKLQFKPGVNRETTRYAAEGQWYETDKVRFRRGLPQKIGGWEQLSSDTYLGVARSLFNWATLSLQNLVSVGTHLKYYIEKGGAYNDITPIRATTAAGDVTFSATNGDATITVSDTNHGAVQNDFVTFSGAASLGGNITAAVLNQEYQVATRINDNSYTIEAKDTSGSTVLANSSDSGNGGSSTVGTYQINTGNEIEVPFTGWGAGTWSSGTWGTSGSTLAPMRLWSQANFGEDLFFVARGGALYYWDASSGVTSRGVLVSSLGGASQVPTVANIAFVSDIFRFAFCFGANPIGSSTLDPMLIRWSDQEDISDWNPTATNQAGSLSLSEGTEIIQAIQARQEVLVWTDAALYGLQYLGAPIVWGATLLGSNLTLISPNAAVYSNNIAYWMGTNKFYYYDGTVKTLPCEVRSYVFDDFNSQQADQVVAGSNEQFDEIWWFYCSEGATRNDRYVVYNYEQGIWYYGNLSRSAWLDSDLRDFPIAATFGNKLVNHEKGVDDNESGTPTAFTANITSTQFDLDDGDRFMLINKMLPDMTFEGSTADSPAATMTLNPLENSGSGRYDPASVGGDSSATVTRTATVPIEAFTGQVFTRVRGRQMSIKIESTAAGVTWKLGAPRMDMRPDGRRG
jgi:hypothetical protein